MAQFSHMHPLTSTGRLLGPNPSAFLNFGCQLESSKDICKAEIAGEALRAVGEVGTRSSFGA